MPRADLSPADPSRPVVASSTSSSRFPSSRPKVRGEQTVLCSFLRRRRRVGSVRAGRGDGGSLLRAAVFVEGDNTATTTKDDGDDDDKDPNRPVVVVTEDQDSDGPLRRARRALADSVNNNVINRHLLQLA